MRVLLLAAAGLAVSTAMAAAHNAPERTLCKPTEAVVFSCSIGCKLVSLCSDGATPKSLNYRFGAPGMVELIHPAPGDAGGFEWSNLPLYGGGITSVSFKRGGYEYSVYAKIGRARGGGDNAGAPAFEDGVTISCSGKHIKTLICDDGGAGFRQSIEWLPRRPSN